MLKKANLEFSGNVILNKLELALRIPRSLAFVYPSPSFTFSSFPPAAFTGLFITPFGFQSPENAVLLYFPF
jgi:hypothetical protein